jgi:hypothetical protein
LIRCHPKVRAHGPRVLSIKRRRHRIHAGFIPWKVWLAAIAQPPSADRSILRMTHSIKFDT